MKTKLALFLFFFLLGSLGQIHSQTLIAKWTFPTGNQTDSLADGGQPVNLTMAIHAVGGTSPIDFSKNGFTTKAAQATGWDNGANTKCWVVQVNTLGHEHLKLSSKQQSGGNNPGPRDYSVQYRIGASGPWTDVPNSTLVTANDWTTAVLDSIDLPEPCNNQASVFIRWIMTSNTNSTGGTVAAGGINKIDDIYFTGKQISTSINDLGKTVEFKVYPNPSVGPLNIVAPEMISAIEILDMQGKIVFVDNSVNSKVPTLNAEIIPKGTYFVRICTISGIIGAKSIIIR